MDDTEFAYAHPLLMRRAARSLGLQRSRPTRSACLRNDTATLMLQLCCEIGDNADINTPKFGGYGAIRDTEPGADQ